MAGIPDIKKISMIGCGSMGGGMALLFAEKGLEVLLEDPSEQAMDAVIEQAKRDGFGERLSKYTGRAEPERIALLSK